MNKYYNLKLNNKGSGIVTILVAIVFLTVLGSMLLMLSYTGFEMKDSERKGNQNYYDTEVAMAEIRIGLQEACSDAIADSLYEYLVNSSDQASAAEDFTASYLDYIGNYSVKDIDGKDFLPKIKLMQNYDKSRSTCKYNISALTKMIRNCRSGKIIINTYGAEEKTEEISDTVSVKYSPEFEGNDVKIFKEGANGKITFSDISITYEQGDRSTTLTTDIIINVPDLSQITSGLNNADIESFSLIMSGDLKQQGNDGNISAIDGSIYANNINNLNGSPLEFDEGTVIVRNDIVSQGKTDFGDNLTFKSNSTVYANNINVEKSKLSISGNTMIANDMNIKGQSNVNIGGQYFGFGSSLVNADESSSIIISGSKSNLNLESCTQLSLAGFCFISDSDDIPDNDIRTGESISPKPNQMVYLADCKYLSYESNGKKLEHNPITVANSTEEIPSVVLNTETILFVVKDSETGKETPRNFDFYGGRLRRVVVNYASQSMIYYFVEFEDNENGAAQDNANRFFKEYYSANPQEVTEFIKKYITIGKSETDFSVSGNAFRYKKDEALAPKLIDYLSNQAREQLVNKASSYTTYFENYKKYLSASKPADALDPESAYCISNEMVEDGKIKEEFDNPFYHKINYEKIKEISETKAFYNGNKVVSVVCSGNKKFPSDFRTIEGKTVNTEDIGLIICYGNITVETGCTYKGLIMCSGNVILDGSVRIEKDESHFNTALSSKSSDEEIILDYFRGYEAKTNDTSGMVGSSSMVFSLVKYENWRKN